jgi:hypothetical protein
MESGGSHLAVNPPWEIPQFLSEEGLRAAQEYYFRTHATQTQMIAQGRAAQGLAKSFLRRKLAREMGEDYKMYTGTALGEASAPEDMASLGIRGELNALLKHIYTRIAPTTPITSPTQEDLTILKHPHGALEVCYAMVFYYGSLLRQYASFASNRRRVLKSIMDEELFKWVWRMVIGFMMETEEAKLNLEPPLLSAGLAFIPAESQRAPLGAKLYEVGMFLLSQTMLESHKRLPLCYYFSVYARQQETLLAMHAGHQELDDVYSLITRRVEGEPVEHPLVAIDALFNGKGNSMQAFDDVLADPAQLAQYIPEAEFAFINQFEDFGNSQRLAATLKRLLPDVRREAIEGQDSSLMPMLLALRVMPPVVREPVLQALPVPLLNLLRNRIANTPQDTVATDLAESIRATMESRRGEAYTVHGPQGQSKAAVAASVRVTPAGGRPAAGAAPPGGAPAPSAAAEHAAARRAEAAERQAAARAAAARAGAAGRTVAPAGEPVPEAVPQAELQAPPPKGPAAAPQEAAPARAAGEAPRTAYLDEPTLLAWRLDRGRIAGISLSARELFTLAGGDARFLVAWVVFTLRTGQVFGLAPERLSKERVEQIVQALRRQAGQRPGLLSAEQLAGVVQQAQGASQAKLLLGLARAAGLQHYLRLPDGLAPVLGSLGPRFGERLLEFLRSPNDEAFKAQRESLSAEERQALQVLQRVARGQ